MTHRIVALLLLGLAWLGHAEPARAAEARLDQRDQHIAALAWPAGETPTSLVRRPPDGALVLDRVPPATVAYATRLLRRAYSGPLVSVLRPYNGGSGVIGVATAEQTRTNELRNPSGAGAVVGGALPTGWVATTGSGLLPTVVATGTEDGRPYVDLRWQGTVTTSAFLGLHFSGNPSVATFDPLR